MIGIDELKTRDIVLTPICADSILLFHQLKMNDVGVSMFFDRNPMMENMEYCGTIIRRVYHRENT